MLDARTKTLPRIVAKSKCAGLVQRQRARWLKALGSDGCAVHTMTSGSTKNRSLINKTLLIQSSQFILPSMVTQ